ncbi:MAG: hypothetical protein K2K10_03990 [Acetatifactor sp.]|nr:hypothetical protein [Acetatifactor sp.]
MRSCGRIMRVEVIFIMNKNLQYIVDNLGIIRQLYDKDVIISVLDKDKVVQGFSLPPGIPPQAEVGSVFEDPSGIFDEVISKGITKHNYLPKEVMGFPVEGNLVPIKDGGQVVGCVICTYSVEGREKVREIATSFQESIQAIDSSVQDVVGGIETLFSMLTSMSKMTLDVEQDVNAAADVVNKINNNASHSNILALNASIEAARSGEAGRGFAVVATEMGKLAKDSGNSATEIKTTLSAIVSHLQAIMNSIKEANDVAKSYMDNISSIKSVLEQTISLASELENDVKL